MGALGTRQRPWAHYGDLGNKEIFDEHYGSPRTQHGARERNMGAQEQRNTQGTGMGTA